MNRKPFNLQAALKGAKVITKSGDKVTSIQRVDWNIDYPILGLIVGDYNSVWCNFTEDGKDEWSGVNDRMRIAAGQGSDLVSASGAVTTTS